MVVMNTMSISRALTTALFFVLLFAFASSRSFVPMNKRSDCSKNMPCKWEICPWSRRFAPRRMECVAIENESCRCPPDSLCLPRPNMVEPLSSPGGAPFIKYEYNCARSEDYPFYRMNRNQVDSL